MEINLGTLEERQAQAEKARKETEATDTYNRYDRQCKRFDLNTLKALLPYLEMHIARNVEAGNVEMTIDATCNLMAIKRQMQLLEKAQ